MHNICVELDSNYDSHPDFQFNLRELKPPFEKLDTFNNLVLRSRKLAPFLSEEALLNLAQDYRKQLQEIFLFLRTQCLDEFEELFLSELEKEVIRLALEELGWNANFSRPQLRKITSLEAQLALKLEAQKYFLGELSHNVVDVLLNTCRKELNFFRENAKKGALKRADLSSNRGATIRKICKELNLQFRELGVFDAMGAYWGKKFRVSGLALELSVPQSGWWQNHLPSLVRGPHTLYAHFDESKSYPKAIVYLSDVDFRNGPTSCYPNVYDNLNLNPLKELIGRVVGVVGGSKDSALNNYYSKQYHQSVGSENFRKHFMRLPKEMRFNSHFGWDVMPESPLEKCLVEDEIKVIGGAGTFIVFDGSRLLHRGGLIESGERIALQVIFSNNSYAQEIFAKINRIFK